MFYKFKLKFALEFWGNMLYTCLRHYIILLLLFIYCIINPSVLYMHSFLHTISVLFGGRTASLCSLGSCRFTCVHKIMVHTVVPLLIMWRLQMHIRFWANNPKYFFCSWELKLRKKWNPNPTIKVERIVPSVEDITPSFISAFQTWTWSRNEEKANIYYNKNTQDLDQTCCFEIIVYKMHTSGIVEIPV